MSMMNLLNEKSLLISYHSLSSYPSTLDVWIQGVFLDLSYNLADLDEVITWMY